MQAPEVFMAITALLAGLFSAWGIGSHQPALQSICGVCGFLCAMLCASQLWVGAFLVVTIALIAWSLAGLQSGMHESE